ncbi:hypothetical protein GOB87_07410 [Acetobacter estunensis]|uniref:Phosphoglycerate mutase n=1 Tax=Acetobacter estunensis TaxID=104097 RepID=A0A967B833_9PROT|nr:histidine phosphatase family protein [Acetobacter estunensis]NHO53791.1 hypothetical protein [Acetobacter estunensis]
MKRAELICIALPLPQAVKCGVFPSPHDRITVDPKCLAFLPVSAPLCVGHVEDRHALLDTGRKDVFLEACLRDRDYGLWAGQPLRDLPPEQVERWVNDPSFQPPEGESRNDMLQRLSKWLAIAPSWQGVAYAALRPGVIRRLVLAALRADATGENVLDVPPETVTALTWAGRWRIRMVGSSAFLK